MQEPRATVAGESLPSAAAPRSTTGGGSAPTAGRRPERPLGDRVQSLRLGQMPERQSSLISNIGLTILVVGIAAVGWYGYSRFLAARPVTASRAGQASGPVANDNAVASAPAAPAPSSPRPASPSRPTGTSQNPKGDVVLEAKGYIVPAHQILVSPKVSGMIVQLNVEEGRRVEKGEVLAVLESTDYAADFERAKANTRLMRERLRELENGNRPEEIQEAEAELREAEALVPQLEAEYKRTADLRRKNSVTQLEYELAESKYLAQVQRVTRLKFAHRLMQLGPRQERIDVAKAELAQAEADVTKTEWRLGNCTIRAPITGTILKKNAEEGNIVNPIAFNGSYSLCDMADLSDLEVDLNIQERDIAVVQVGQKCRVRAEAYAERIYEGHVDRLMPIADRAKGAIPVRVKIRIPAEEEGVFLKPEMGAIVTFLKPSAAPPATAAKATALDPVSTQRTP